MHAFFIEMGNNVMNNPYEVETIVFEREHPEQYDTSKFKGYILSVLPDWSGFSFQLLDRTLKKIEFRLAWIRHTIEAETSEYENIVMTVTTF